jgi:hypothetical protein
LVPTGAASAATLSDSASAVVSLDSPGAITLDAFDPALGTLSSVQVSLSADVVVQACVENTGAEAGTLAAGSALGSLAAQFPGGAGADRGGSPAPGGPQEKDSWGGHPGRGPVTA